MLLLEAGGSDDTDLVSDTDKWPMNLGGENDWGFVTEPNPDLAGRSLLYSMGKVLGGSSSINVATWSRGHEADWDMYAAESGDTAWGYKAVLDLYRGRVEDWKGVADPEFYGIGGPMHVQPVGSPDAFSLALLDAAESVGVMRFPNSGGQMMKSSGGAAIVDNIIHNGKRQSVYRSYVYPRLLQPNLTVLTKALATRILFEGKRAVGVEFEHNGELRQARAVSEVVVSLGAIQTPKLLMQSGIGDQDELRKFDIARLGSTCLVWEKICTITLRLLSSGRRPMHLCHRMQEVPRLRSGRPIPPWMHQTFTPTESGCLSLRRRMRPSIRRLTPRGRSSWACDLPVAAPST